MTAHQDGAVAAERAGQVAPHLDVLDQQRGVAEFVVGIPGRYFVADIGAHVQQWLELLCGHPERNHARAVVMHDRLHVCARLIDAAVDKALEVRRAAARIDGLAFERELHDVGGLDALRRARPRQQEAVRIVRMTGADVPERIDDAFVGENAVGGDDLFEECFKFAHEAAYKMRLTDPSEPSSWASMRTRRSLIWKLSPARLST